MAKKAKHRQYQEPKAQATFSLTKTAIEKLKQLAEQNQTSASELVEQFARGKIAPVRSTGE
jgi:hypothetical protein